MLTLSEEEQDMLNGEHGEAMSIAMRLITRLGQIKGATKLIDINSVHIDGCIFYGQAGLDYAQKLYELGARVKVPTTVNVGSMDLLHPGLVKENTEHEKFIAQGARKIMQVYADLGVNQIWTCAPYQVDSRPEFGTDIVWAESNAIVFANSVLGARTDRYGDFMDLACAITGKTPYAGLHLPQNRTGHLIIDCSALDSKVFDLDITYPLLGYLTGQYSGTRNPVLIGFPSAISEDYLKAFGAAAASAGGVGLFHIVGCTPEAKTLESVIADQNSVETYIIDANQLNHIRKELTTAARNTKLDAVTLGTPHASLFEISQLHKKLLSIGPIHKDVQFYVNTGRSIFAQASAQGLIQDLEQAGVQFVVDTCAYMTSIFKPGTKTVITNSGKVAHYAPANMGVDIVLGTLGECVESAHLGKVTWNEKLFHGN